jgi:Cof subfamily protein (haloacid dehalogenase superfamily)
LEDLLTELAYKLIVSDLDGTLLNGNARITDRTLDAIRRYHSLGGLFTYATGRTDESARAFAELAGIKIPGIAINGGKIVNHADGKIIHETFMDAERTKQAFKMLRGHKKDVIVYLDNSRYIADYTEVIDKYLERVRHGLYITKDIDEAIDKGGAVKKILVIDPGQEDDVIVGIVKPIFGGNFNFIKSDKDYYEFIPPGTSKGAALAILARYLGIRMEDVIAVGDHLNDVSMIEAAGLGFAVANAEQEALDAADCVTASNNDDGVALIIEKLIRGEHCFQKN